MLVFVFVEVYVKGIQLGLFCVWAEYRSDGRFWAGIRYWDGVIDAIEPSRTALSSVAFVQRWGYGNGVVFRLKRGQIWSSV